MQTLLLFLIVFAIIFSIYMIYFFIRNKKVIKITMEMIYLENKYKLDLSKINLIKLAKQIAFINSLIFTISIFIMNLIDNILLKFLTSFVLIFVLIFIFYDILAIYYKRKK